MLYPLRCLALFALVASTTSFCPAPLGRPVAMRSPAATVRRCIAPPAMADELWNSNDDFALTEYIARHQSAARCGAPGRVLGDLEEAWVLIFNVGKQDEGVYTLQGRTERAAAYVLMFEFTDDADRFAQLLQAEGFEGATPLKWAAEQIHAFCLAGEFEVSLVPQVRLITHATASRPCATPSARVAHARAHRMRPSPRRPRTHTRPPLSTTPAALSSPPPLSRDGIVMACVMMMAGRPDHSAYKERV